MKKIISSLVLLLLLVGIGKVQGQLAIPGTTNGADWGNTSIYVDKGGSNGGMEVSGNTIKILTNAPCCAWNRYDSYFIVTLDNKEYSVPAYLNVSLDKTTWGSWLNYKIEESDTKIGSYSELASASNDGNSPFSHNNLKLKKSTKFIKISADKTGSNAAQLWVTSINVTKSLSVSPTSITTFSDANNVLTAPITITYSNIGGNLSLSSDSPDFTVNPSTINLTAGTSGTANATVTFSPTSLGAKTGDIIITDNSYTDNKTKVSVSGNATIPVITNFVAGIATYTSIPLSWDNIAGVEDYYLTVINDNTSTTVIDNQSLGVVNSYTLNNLVPNTLYTVKLQAKYSSQTSSPATVQKSTLNMTPQNIQTSAVTEQSFTSSWSAVDGVDGYEIKVYKTSDNSLVTTQRTTDLNYTFTGLTRGTNYYYTVSAFVGSVVSQPSSNINVMTAVFLPLSITQTTGINYEWIAKNNVDLSWIANRGFELKQSSANTVIKFNDIPLSANVDLYRTRNTTTLFSGYPNIYIETSTDGLTWEIIKTILQENPTGGSDKTDNPSVTLSQDVRQLRIRREPATGNGITTDGSAFVQKIEINPVTVTALEATNVAATNFTANWQAVSSTDVTGYAVSVYQKNSDGTTTILSGWDKQLVGNVTTVEVPSLSSLQTYYYVVQAVFASGETQPSNEIKVVTMVKPEVEGATEVTGISFIANWVALSGVTGYYINVYKASDHSLVVGNQSAASADTTLFIGNLAQGTEYYYTVSAFVNISAGIDVISLPVTSDNFTTAVTDENLGLTLTYTTPADITLGENKEIIYAFSGVAGQFIFSTVKSKTYNALNPNQFKIYESADKTTWTLLKTYGNGQFENSNVILNLSKTTRYIKLVFTKTWSCDATITLKAGAKITKALEVTPSNLANFSDANEITTNTFTVKYSNIHTLLNVVASSHFSVSPTTITPDASGTGSAVVTVTFNPNGIQSYNEQIKVEDSDYTTNFVTVNVSGVARIQPVTGLKTTAVDFTSLTLAWDNVSADQYLLTVTTTETLEEVFSETIVAGMQYKVEGLASNTSYTVSIKAQFGTTFSTESTLVVSTKNIADQPQPVEITENPTINEVLRHNTTLSELTFAGGSAKDSYGNEIEGIFTFKDPNMVLKQGENCELMVVFQPTPADFLPTEFSIFVKVLKGLQTIVWAQKESLSELTIDTMISLTATTDSGLGIDYVSSNPEIAEVVDNYLIVKTAGTLTLTALQSGNADFEAAESIAQTIIIRSKTTGGNEEEEDNPTSVMKPLKVNIYPNPVKNTLFISGFDIEKVEVFDVQGRIVLREDVVGNNDVIIDVSKLVEGNYFVRVISGSQMAVKTITIVK